MNERERERVGEQREIDGDEVVGLDAYSRDGQFVGRVSGYLPAVPEDAQGIEEGHTDRTGHGGRRRGVPHLVVNGTGTVIQSTLIVTLDALEVDIRGRRVTLPVTVAELEAMPQHDPHADHGAHSRPA